MGQGNARIYNLISLIFVILTVLVLAFVVTRVLQPVVEPVAVAQVLPTTVSLPTITPTYTQSMTPIPTETFTPNPSATITPLPSLTPIPSATPIASATFTDTPPPTAIPSLTITATLPFTATPPATATQPAAATVGFTPPPTAADIPPPYPFSLREGQPVFTSNFANTAGCAWQGIGGQVFDLNDSPLLGVTVHVFGSGVDVRVNSGTNTIYGTSGWEVPLNTNLTGNSYRVELLSPGGTTISPQVTVTFTANDCARNLALVNFKQNRPL
ncbi:MAG: hypothetical protein SGJ24_07410 [Chloroflexota bacterium]|nr:hypothetical protein [Chloroflexota bacterium]